jgi:hypothetical protein
MDVSLLDAAGRLVSELTQTGKTGSEKVFSIRGVAPGLYMLRIKADDAIATERLVVE